MILSALDGKSVKGDRTGMKNTAFKANSAKFTVPAMLAAAVVLLLILSGFNLSIPPMDDTYIHLVYGRSLLSSAPLCFNSLEPSSGFTSPLWLLPSAAASFAGATGAPVLLMLFSLLAAAAALFLAPSLTAILLLMIGPFFFHASSGMETALSCLAVIAIWRCIRDGCSITVASIILAGAFLVRPELGILIIPVSVSLQNRSPLNILRLAAPAIIAGLLWVVWNIHSTGLPLPSTFYAKQPVSWITSAISGFPGLFKSLLIISPLLFFAAAASIVGLIKDRTDKRRNTSLALIPLLLFTVSIYLQPNSFFQMRYYVPFLTATALAAGYWLSGLPRRKLNTFILVLSMLPGLIIFSGRRVQASRDVFLIDVQPALYFSASSEHTVAAADIGALKWITDLNILDIDGLVTPERLPGPDRLEWEWISERSDYLLVFPQQYSSLILEAGDSIEFIMGWGSGRNVICGEDSVGLWKIL